jgi:hypothetical protein
MRICLNAFFFFSSGDGFSFFPFFRRRFFASYGNRYVDREENKEQLKKVTSRMHISTVAVQRIEKVCYVRCM